MAPWVAGGLLLFAFFLRISFSGRVDSDGANSALQAWDLVHGHLMMHGWIFGDVTFYTFELPLIGIVELLFGMGNVAVHVSSALVYLIVTACAVAVATTSSRGPARVVRSLVVVTVLAVPLLAALTVFALLEEPDHIGTSMFLLVTFLLIDRGPDRRFTAPLASSATIPSAMSRCRPSSWCAAIARSPDGSSAPATRPSWSPRSCPCHWSQRSWRRYGILAAS
jgi:hypothetical protein